MSSKTKLLLVLLALVLHLPLVTAGSYADDYVHRLALEAHQEPGQQLGSMGPLSLFDFGVAQDYALDDGRPGLRLPWFTEPDWRARFLRPLPSAELSLTHALVPGPPERAVLVGHLFGLVLLAATVLAVARLLGSLELPPRAAALALGIVVCSDAAVLPVGWAANRSTVWCLLFVALATSAAGRGLPWRALLLACLATACKESGLLAFPLAGLRLFGVGGGAAHRDRWRFAGAAALLVGAYLTHYLLAGYGTHSLFYAPPWSEPARYLERLFVLLGLGLPSLAGPVPVDGVLIAPAAALPAAALGLVVAGLVAWRLAPDARRHPAAPFLATWMLLGFLPEASAPPSDRLLWMSTVGAAGLLGLALDRRLAAWDQAPRGARALTALLLITALPLSGTAAAGLGLLNANIARQVRAMALDAELGEGVRTVFLLQTSNQFSAFVLPGTYAVEQGDTEARFDLLQVGRRPVRWTRTGERSCTFESLGEPFFSGPFEAVYRTSTQPPTLGQTWRSGELTLTALEVDGRGLRSLELRAEASLDASRLVFARETGGRLRSVAPPALGESLDLVPGEPALPLMP